MTLRTVTFTNVTNADGEAVTGRARWRLTQDSYTDSDIVIASRGTFDIVNGTGSVDLWANEEGAVANEYAVVVCPTITYVRAGGRVAGSTVGPRDEAQLEAWVRRIER